MRGAALVILLAACSDPPPSVVLDAMPAPLDAARAVGLIDVSVVDLAGQPVEEIPVAVWEPDGRVSATFETNVDGTISLQVTSGASVTVLLIGNFGAYHFKTVTEVEPGDHLTFQQELPIVPQFTPFRVALPAIGSGTQYSVQTSCGTGASGPEPVLDVGVDTSRCPPGSIMQLVASATRAVPIGTTDYGKLVARNVDVDRGAYVFDGAWAPDETVTTNVTHASRDASFVQASWNAAGWIAQANTSAPDGAGSLVMTVPPVPAGIPASLSLVLSGVGTLVEQRAVPSDQRVITVDLAELDAMPRIRTAGFDRLRQQLQVSGVGGVAPVAVEYRLQCARPNLGFAYWSLISPRLESPVFPPLPPDLQPECQIADQIGAYVVDDLRYEDVRHDRRALIFDGVHRQRASFWNGGGFDGGGN